MGTTDTQTVYYEIDPINEINLSGGDTTLTIDTATAGSEPSADTYGPGQCYVTTNETGKKITAVLNANMPANTTLRMWIANFSGAQSNAWVSLTSTAQNMIYSMETLAEN
ncbi:MAG: hypothetical protein ABIH00_05110 [Armatimonadota bacterium]